MRHLPLTTRFPLSSSSSTLSPRPLSSSSLGPLCISSWEVAKENPSNQLVVEMLASIPQMETARSLPRNPDVVARHPSAEDLDAAQQLISSAQAGREHPVERPRDETRAQSFEADPLRNRNEMDNGVDNPGYASGEVNASASDKLSSSPKSQKDTSFLGHSCRLVF